MTNDSAAGLPVLRARTLLGRSSGFTSGPSNTIVDVPGIRVGHTTIDDAVSIFTGATAIVVEGASPRHPVRANLFVGNGYGKFVGATQIGELGEVETPIILTSTLAAFRAADAVVTWVLREHGTDLSSVNAVVGEINDSWLSDHLARPLTADHFLEAMAAASTDPVKMGNVGGGTGACALGFKAGIGSSSRVMDLSGRLVTIGTIVQANMDGDLRLSGQVVHPADFGLTMSGPSDARGSCVVVIAVDVPLEPHMLRRVAARAMFALARVGARFSHGSGDYALAVSTSHEDSAWNIGHRDLTVLFEATMDLVEEAVVDALLAAESIRSATGRTAFALPQVARGNQLQGVFEA